MVDGHAPVPDHREAQSATGPWVATAGSGQSHTIEIAAMWAVLTRLEQPKHPNLTLLQKLKLYNGKTLPGFTEDNVIELKREAANEGMHGISPRYIQAVVYQRWGNRRYRSRVVNRPPRPVQQATVIAEP